jgi:hypothetical protein
MNIELDYQECKSMSDFRLWRKYEKVFAGSNRGGSACSRRIRSVSNNSRHSGSNLDPKRHFLAFGLDLDHLK